MGSNIFKVDASTDKPFSGNPADVCILSEKRDDRWMQSIAREMNFSETAFLTPKDDGYDLRWFTPIVEVDLCGHATLASAHIFFDGENRSETETPVRDVSRHSTARSTHTRR
jgi:PhzF family phenazine biosynthesis protein